MKTLSLWLGPAAASTFAALFLLCEAPAVVAAEPGGVVTQARDFVAFKGLRLGTSALVFVRQGDRNEVMVQADASVAPLIETFVKGDVLVVEDKQPNRSAPVAARVTITVRRITGIETRGAVVVQADGLNAPELSVSMGGASRMALRGVSADTLHVSLGGASELTADGRVMDLSAALGGSSELHAAALEAHSVSVTAGGSSDAVVWAGQALSVAAGGSADVGYYGSARPAVASRGSATVRRLGAAPPKPQ